MFFPGPLGLVDLAECCFRSGRLLEGQAEGGRGEEKKKSGDVFLSDVFPLFNTAVFPSSVAHAPRLGSHPG